MITYNPCSGMMIQEAAYQALKLKRTNPGTQVMLLFNDVHINMNLCNTVEEVLDSYDRQRARCS